MFAVIERLWTGVFLWVTIGVSIGYAMALLGDRQRADVLIPMAAGLLGSLVVGLGLGLSLSEDLFWVCNIGAAIGGFVLAAGSEWLLRRRAG